MIIHASIFASMIEFPYYTTFRLRTPYPVILYTNTKELKIPILEVSAIKGVDI